MEKPALLPHRSCSMEHHCTVPHRSRSNKHQDDNTISLPPHKGLCPLQSGNQLVFLLLLPVDNLIVTPIISCGGRNYLYWWSGYHHYLIIVLVGSIKPITKKNEGPTSPTKLVSYTPWKLWVCKSYSFALKALFHLKLI